MSILQDYEEARDIIGAEKYDAINIYLEKICPLENVDKYYKGLNLVMQKSPEIWQDEENKLRNEFNITLLSDVLYKKEEWDKYDKWFNEDYKKRKIEILSVWESDFDDVRCNAIIYQNNKQLANIVVSFESSVINDLTNYDAKDLEKACKKLIYEHFDDYKKLPKISHCSKLLQEVYDCVCESDATMCHITKDDWKDYYSDRFNERDIERLKEEVKMYQLEDVITFDDREYKIVGWGNLETSFNDDRKLERNKNHERNER